MQEHAEALADEMEAAPAPANPLLLGMSPPEYVLNALSNLRFADLEQALLLLPFNYALDLLGYLCYWLERGIRVNAVHCQGMHAAMFQGISHNFSMRCQKRRHAQQGVGCTIICLAA